VSAIAGDVWLLGDDWCFRDVGSGHLAAVVIAVGCWRIFAPDEQEVPGTVEPLLHGRVPRNKLLLRSSIDPTSHRQIRDKPS
jgi:hypothetical protein